MPTAPLEKRNEHVASASDESRRHRLGYHWYKHKYHGPAFPPLLAEPPPDGLASARRFVGMMNEAMRSYGDAWDPHHGLYVNEQ